MDLNNLLNAEVLQGFMTRDNIFLLMVLVGTILAVLAVGMIVLGVNSPLKRKLKTIGGAPEETSGSKRIGSALENVAPVMIPNSAKERQSVQLQLIQAGYHDSGAMSLFYALKLITALLGLFFSAMAYLLMNESSYMPLVIIGSLWLGLFGPNMVLARWFQRERIELKQRCLMR